jgi:hypothetical protein
MVVAVAEAAPGVEDDIVLFEPAEMQRFVEPGPGMIWQTGEIHGGEKIRYFINFAADYELYRFSSILIP